MLPTTGYVVQSNKDCIVFQSREFAEKHAKLNAPATIWYARDVTEVQGSCVATCIGANPYATIWE